MTTRREQSLALRVLVWTVVFLTSWSRVGTSQTPAHFCVWPASRPPCSSWFITEAGLYTRFTDLQPSDERLLFEYTLGWMRNVGSRTAVGIEVFGGIEGEVRGGAALRVRQWRSPRVALDLALGSHLFGDASSQDVTPGSPMVTVRLTYADKIAATGRLDVLKLRCGIDCYARNPNATSTRLYLGAELGSKLGVLGMAVAAAAGAVWAAALGL